MTLGIFLVLVLANPLIVLAPKPPLTGLIIEENSLEGNNYPVLPKNLATMILGDLGAILEGELEAENTLLADLSFCESGNRDDIKILDVNGKYSYGLFQWQEQSWIFYSKKYGLFPFAEDQEMMNFIYDRNYQTKLTRLVLQEPNGWLNWKNCFLKLWKVNIL